MEFEAKSKDKANALDCVDTDSFTWRSLRVKTTIALAYWPKYSDSITSPR
jgi:hypothetical protein